MEQVFREYGLSEVIRTDNGSPFASVGLGGLSSLPVWWIKLGIIPERIEPGHPEQNGRLERFHRTLKADTASPPQENMRKQQQAFDGFRAKYNEERPHEALEQDPPARHYQRSSRSYPSKLRSAFVGLPTRRSGLPELGYDQRADQLAQSTPRGRIRPDPQANSDLQSTRVLSSSIRGLSAD